MTLALTVAVALAAVAAVAVAIARQVGRTGRLVLTAALVAGAAAAGLALAAVQAEDATPRDLRAVEYVQAASCRKCHPSQYESWHRSFHRTMTQEAAPDAVIGDFGDVKLEHFGHPVRLFREGDEFFMDLVDHRWERNVVERGRDPATVADPPRRVYRVDRLVGSNQLQVYLSKAADGGYLTLPLEWNERDGRWVTSLGNYLQPPLAVPSLFANATLWNETCIFCHNTKPNPGAQPADKRRSEGLRYDSRVRELGIACEACHGPGALHAAANRSPLRRHALQLTGRADPTIVHPGRLDQEASVQVCGRCHGKWKARPASYHAAITEGDCHVPGHDPLGERYAEPTEDAAGVYDGRMAGYFWPDGSPRPSAMEYQGVRLSPCYRGGELTCLSCHTMHRFEDARDQLRFVDDPATPRFEDDESCLQCHAAFRADAARRAHTHHELTSEGSRCLHCHQPYTTFGLMKTVRAHRIASPDAHVTARTRLPNGCNQCHVDRTLPWTAQWLTTWYGQPPLPPLGDARDTIALTAVDLLQGHALNRVIAAVTLGWEPARAAAPGDFRVLLLLDALADDYPAVRQNAWVALHGLPGFEAATFDYLAPPAERRAALEALRARLPLQPSEAQPGAVRLEPAGGLDAATRARLRETRDRTPLTILE